MKKTASTAAAPLPKRRIGSPDAFDGLATMMRERFTEALQGTSLPPLFTTDATGLYEAYLSGFTDLAERQVHTCGCCRRFIETYGGLVFIDPDNGALVPAFWPVADVPDMYMDAVANLWAIVQRASVTGVFVTSDKEWGHALTGEWTHFAVTPPAAFLFLHNRATKAPSERAAELREDYGILNRALAEFNAQHVAIALGLLESDALYRAEKVAGPARWLQKLHHIREAHKNARVRNHLTWLEVANAPTGFCHVRSAMIGTLLEDIAAGLPFADVKRKFDAKMKPTVYQRPQAAPTAGNVAQGEKLIEKMGAQRSLLRRFARLDECKTFWVPNPAPAPQGAKGGVFGHLVTKDEAPPLAPLQIPATNMTWAKFCAIILPTARRIEFFTDNRSDAYAGIVTAVDPEAPPIIQWDMADERNPVSTYVYTNGSIPVHWSLPGNAWVTVNAIVRRPSKWSDRYQFEHQGDGYILVLDGARDTRNGGLGLFPEILRAEFREIRATIEAYSNNGKLEGAEAGNANGMSISPGLSGRAYRLRVTSAAGVAEYRIDRWD